MINEIQDWINSMLDKYDIEECEMVFGNSFGFVDMPDGRKAQVKVLLEMDEDNWD